MIGCILSIPFLGNGSKVRSSIIESISIDMITFKTVSWYETKDETMQSNKRRLPVDSRHSEGVSMARVVTPSHASDANKFSIGGIDDCVSMDVPITGSEWNTDNVLVVHVLAPPLRMVQA